MRIAEALDEWKEKTDLPFFFSGYLNNDLKRAVWLLSLYSDAARERVCKKVKIKYGDNEFIAQQIFNKLKENSL